MASHQHDSCSHETHAVQGRTLIFIDHPSQEFTEFLPVLANIDLSQCKVVLINLVSTPASGFLAAMVKSGIREWDLWGYSEPPVNLDGVMRRMIDLIEQWEPYSIFAPDSSPALAAMSRFRPRLHDNNVPRLFLTYSEGFASEAISLTADQGFFDRMEIIYLDCYKRAGGIKAIQTFVEQPL